MQMKATAAAERAAAVLSRGSRRGESHAHATWVGRKSS